MQFFAAAVPFLMPLVLAPHLLFFYDITPKVAVLLAAAAIALAFASIELDSVAAFCGTRVGRWYAAAAGAWLVLVCLATLGSVHPELSWNGSNWRRMGALTQCALVPLALWTAAIASRSRPRLHFLLRAICAAGLVASIYGIAQYFGFDPWLPASGYEAGEGVFRIVRPPGTLGHSDYFAAFLIWPVFAGIALFRDENRRVWRALALAAAITGAIAILLSGSRGAVLGLIGGLCLLAALIRPNVRLIAGITAAAIGALAILLVSPAGQRLRARAHWISEDRAGGARLLLWRDSLNMAAAKPLTGFGPETFVAEFPRFQSEDLARAYPDFFQESPHNFLLDALTEVGIPGVLALAAIAAAGIVAGWRGRSKEPSFAPALLAGLTATLIVQQFVVFIAPTAFYFFLGAGLLAGLGAADATIPQFPSVWRNLAFGAGLVIAVLFGSAAYRLLSADFALARVRRLLDASDPGAAAGKYRQMLSGSTSGVTADLYFSRRWAAAAADAPDAVSKLYYAQIAAGAASRATRSPEQRQNAWYNLAVLMAATNDTAAVESSLRASIAAAPNWYKPHWSLARLLALKGREEEARVEARRALYLNAAKDPEVSSTLAEILSSGDRSP